VLMGVKREGEWVKERLVAVHTELVERFDSASLLVKLRELADYGKPNHNTMITHCDLVEFLDFFVGGLSISCMKNRLPCYSAAYMHLTAAYHAPLYPQLCSGICERLTE
jgi:hypothetical protein